jgi:hypothetical protein
LAHDAAAKSEESLNAHRTPLTGGGYVLHGDPNRTSMKEALIAIACCGIYFEAVMKIVYREAKAA